MSYLNPASEIPSYQDTVALVHEYPMCVLALRLALPYLSLRDGAQVAGYLLNVFFQGILTVQFCMSSLARLAELTRTH